MITLAQFIASRREVSDLFAALAAQGHEYPGEMAAGWVFDTVPGVYLENDEGTAYVDLRACDGRQAGEYRGLGACTSALYSVLLEEGDVLTAEEEARRDELAREREELDETASFERGLYLGGDTRDRGPADDAERALEEFDEENGEEWLALFGKEIGQ